MLELCPNYLDFELEGSIWQVVGYQNYKHLVCYNRIDMQTAKFGDCLNSKCTSSRSVLGLDLSHP